MNVLKLVVKMLMVIPLGIILVLLGLLHKPIEILFTKVTRVVATTVIMDRRRTGCTTTSSVYIWAHSVLKPKLGDDATYTTLIGRLYITKALYVDRPEKRCLFPAISIKPKRGTSSAKFGSRTWLKLFYIYTP